MTYKEMIDVIRFEIGNTEKLTDVTKEALLLAVAEAESEISKQKRIDGLLTIHLKEDVDAFTFTNGRRITSASGTDITVESTEGLSEGDSVYIYGAEKTQNNQQYEITQINGTTVRLDKEVSDCLYYGSLLKENELPNDIVTLYKIILDTYGEVLQSIHYAHFSSLKELKVRYYYFLTDWNIQFTAPIESGSVINFYYRVYYKYFTPQQNIDSLEQWNIRIPDLYYVAIKNYVLYKLYLTVIRDMKQASEYYTLFLNSLRMSSDCEYRGMQREIRWW